MGMFYHATCCTDQQGNRRLHCAHDVHSRHPLPINPIVSEHNSNGMIPSAARHCWRSNDPLAVSALQCIVNGEENTFVAIGNAAYRQCAGGGPSHGQRQQAQKIL